MTQLTLLDGNKPIDLALHTRTSTHRTEHPTAHAFDNNAFTYWAASQNQKHEWLQLEFPHSVTATAISIEIPSWHYAPAAAEVRASADGTTWLAPWRLLDVGTELQAQRLLCAEGGGNGIGCDATATYNYTLDMSSYLDTYAISMSSDSQNLAQGMLHLAPRYVVRSVLDLCVMGR